MELKLLNKQELEEWYRREMVWDFPRTELKPLGSMLRLMDREDYQPLLALENGQAVGYAVLWLTQDGQGGLLEYFAVLRGKRGGGIGGRVLAALAQRCGQLFGEAEAPDSADPAENDLRRRRIAFYQRHGFRLLDYDCALFGVHYRCLYRGPLEDDRKVQRLHRGVYEGYFSPAHLERYVQLPLAPGEPIHPAPNWLEEDELEYEEGPG
jgi:GNAT superfamily N-acetyltransferase